ncbi:MAG: bifunctional protein FolC, partial [Firmicutes bacterium]|nr:bifunctional protein FolC [Bacillota bacterium]
MMTTKEQAEDLIYRSYMLVGRRLKYDAPDSEKRHPEYTRTVIRQLDKRCGKENILVTGSKGKGSAAVMTDAILRAHGKNIGLLTSPHIFDFNERIRINGENIPDAELIKYCEKIAPTLELIDMTIGEREYISPIAAQVLVALLHFYGKT